MFVCTLFHLSFPISRAHSVSDLNSVRNPRVGFVSCYNINSQADRNVEFENVKQRPRRSLRACYAPGIKCMFRSLLLKWPGIVRSFGPAEDELKSYGNVSRIQVLLTTLCLPLWNTII